MVYTPGDRTWSLSEYLERQKSNMPTKKSEHKKSDFPSLRSAEFSQAEADQAALGNIKKKWDKYSKNWPEEIKSTILRLCKLVKQNQSNFKTPSSHAVWKDGNWNFGHWVVMNGIYGDNAVSLIGMKHRLKDAYPKINFDKFHGPGLDDVDEDDNDDEDEDHSSNAGNPKSDLPKRSKRRQETLESPKRSARIKKMKQVASDSNTDTSDKSSKGTKDVKDAREMKVPMGKPDKRKNTMPHLQHQLPEAYYSSQRPFMGGYGYSTGGNAFLPMGVPSQSMGASPLQQPHHPHTTNVQFDRNPFGQMPTNNHDVAVVHLRQEMEARLTSQERAHLSQMENLRANMEQQLQFTKEELYGVINQLANRLTSLEGSQEE